MVAEADAEQRMRAHQQKADLHREVPILEQVLLGLHHPQPPLGGEQGEREDRCTREDAEPLDAAPEQEEGEPEQEHRGEQGRPRKREVDVDEQQGREQRRKSALEPARA